MATNNKNLSAPSRLLPMLSRLNFAFLAVYAAFIIIFDSSNVITRESTYHRWMFEGLLFFVFTVFWVVINKVHSSAVIFTALVGCVVAELALAGFMTYWERGMASTSTLLYLLPIISMALWKSRTFTIAVSLLASAMYMVSSTKYFYDFFNEGYRVQLYGEIFFYSAVFIIFGTMIANLAHASKQK